MKRYLLLLLVFVGVVVHAGQVDQLLKLLQEVGSSSSPTVKKSRPKPQVTVGGTSFEIENPELPKGSVAEISVSKGATVQSPEAYRYVHGHDPVPVRTFDDLVGSGRIRQLAVLGQSGSTCGVHAVKNAQLGLRCFDNQAAVYNEMMLQSYYQSHFSADCLRNNLREDEVQDLINRVVPKGEKERIYALQNVERFVNVFELSDKGGVLTEGSATMAYRLSQPSYVISFVLNTVSATDNHKAEAHWIAFTVRKQHGVVTDILFMDSVNGQFDKNRAKNLFDLCRKDTNQFMKEMNGYNTGLINRKFTEKYQNLVIAGRPIDRILNSLAETAYHNFELMSLVQGEIVWGQRQLDDNERSAAIGNLLELLGEKNHRVLQQKALEIGINLDSWLQQIRDELGGDAIDVTRVSRLAQYVSSNTFDVIVGGSQLSLVLSSDQIDQLAAEMRNRNILGENHNDFVAELTRIKNRA